MPLTKQHFLCCCLTLLFVCCKGADNCSAIYDFSRGYSNNIQAVSVNASGNLLCSKFQQPFYKEFLFDLHSCTKSVLSILAGIAIQQNFIQSEDDFITKYISEAQIKNTDSRWQQLTIKHLLTMRSGFVPDENLLRYKTVNAVFANIKFAESPDGKFNYNEFDPQLLVLVLEKAVRMPLKDFAEKNLFVPLQISNYEWPLFKDQLTGGTGLRLTSDDMAKIGWLMTDTGRWNKTPLMAEDYWKKSLQNNFGNGYGYYWWLYTDGDFSAMGHDCQYIYCSPSKRLSFSLSSFVNDSLREKLISSIRDSALSTPTPVAKKVVRTETNAPLIEMPEWLKIFYTKPIKGKSNFGKGILEMRYTTDSCLQVNFSSKDVQLKIAAGNGKQQLAISKIRKVKQVFLSSVVSTKNKIELLLEDAYSHHIFSGNLSQQSNKILFEITLQNESVFKFRQTQ